MKYIYHVAYFHKRKAEQGLGTCTSTVSGPLDSEEAMIVLKESIKKDFKLDEVVVLNFILLRKEGAEE